VSESKLSATTCGIINSMGGHVSKVEAHASAAGIPDLDFCIQEIEGHIELKYGNKLKKPELRPSQVRWFRDRIKAGGKPFFLLLDGDTNKVYLIGGSWHDKLKGKQFTRTWIDLAHRCWEWGDEFKQGLNKYIKTGK